MLEHKKIFIMESSSKKQKLILKLGDLLNGWEISTYDNIQYLDRPYVVYDQAIAVLPSKAPDYDPKERITENVQPYMAPGCGTYCITEAGCSAPVLAANVKAAINQGVKTETTLETEQSDMVNSPSHYTGKLSDLGIEVIDIANACNLNGNRFSALRYLLRAGYKFPEKEIEDLEKLKKYIDFEIRNLKNEPVSDTRRKKEGIEDG